VDVVEGGVCAVAGVDVFEYVFAGEVGWGWAVEVGGECVVVVFH